MRKIKRYANGGSKGAPMRRLVICMKWGTLYGPEYVNLLHRAVKHFLPDPHEFICMTDNADGFDPSVTVEPLPELPIKDSFWIKGGWPKLAVFKPGFIPDGTRVLFVDLDTIITGDMSAMFETGPQVTMVQEWKRLVDYLNPFRAQKQLSSVFAFDAGREGAIYDAFVADPVAAQQTFRIEQYFLAHHATALNTWPAGWIESFKRHLLPPRLGVRDAETVAQPDAQCKMLIFHGEPRPIDVVQDQVWGKRFRYGHGPIPYMLDYWRQFGIEPPTSQEKVS